MLCLAAVVLKRVVDLKAFSGLAFADIHRYTFLQVYNNLQCTQGAALCEDSNEFCLMIHTPQHTTIPITKDQLRAPGSLFSPYYCNLVA